MNSSSGLSPFIRPAVVVAVIAGLAKLFQAISGILIAHKFGAGDLTDAYMLAKSLPVGIYLVCDSLLYNSFVPVFRKHQEDYPLLNTIALTALGAALFLAALLLVGAPWLLSALGPGANSETRLLSIDMLRVAGLAVLVAAPSSMLKAFNACHGRFILVSLDGLVISGAMLASLVFFPDSMGIWPLVVALPAAFILLVLSQGLGAKKYYHWSKPSWSNAHLQELALLLAPLALLNIIRQVNILFMNGIASFIGEGAISCLNYSYNIAQIPVSIIDLVLFSIFFPFAAGLAAENNLHRLANIFLRTARFLLYVLVPMAAWLILLRYPIIALLLEHNQFDASATQMTTSGLLGHAIAMPFWALEALGGRCLFAVRRHWAYFWIVGARLVANVVLCLVLVPQWGVLGVSVSFAASYALGAALCICVTLRATPTPKRSPNAMKIISFITMLPISVSAVVLAVYGVEFAQVNFASLPLSGYLFACAITAAAGVASVYGLAYLLRKRP